MILLGGTSTQINCIGPMNVCAKNHAFSTICEIFSPSSYTTSLIVHSSSTMHPTSVDENGSVVDLTNPEVLNLLLSQLAYAPLSVDDQDVMDPEVQ